MIRGAVAGLVGLMGREGGAVSDDEAIRYAVNGAVATLTMDQQHNRNALTPALMSGLSRGLETALADEAVGVVVLTNAGPAFSAGADLSGGTPAAAGGGKQRGARRDGLAGLLAANDNFLRYEARGNRRRPVDAVRTGPADQAVPEHARIRGQR